MTKEKVQEVIDIYKETLEKLEAKPERHEIDGVPLTRKEKLNHCYWMINEIESFLKEDRIEKAFRWLGFVQGILWSARLYTIPELADHNRP